MVVCVKVTLNRVRKAIERIAPLLASQYSVRFIVLFGSIMDGAMGPLSDIDVAISFREKASAEERLTRRLDVAYELERALGIEDIDLVVIEEAPPALKFKIFSTGAVIFEDVPGSAEDAYVRALSEYYDYQEFLEKQYATAREYLDKVTRE